MLLYDIYICSIYPCVYIKYLMYSWYSWYSSTLTMTTGTTLTTPRSMECLHHLFVRYADYDYRQALGPYAIPLLLSDL